LRRRRLPAVALRPLELRPLPADRPGRRGAGALLLLRVQGAALGGRIDRTDRGARGGRRVSADTAARPVLVVDFGAQYAQLIARRVREASVYSELVPHTITAEEVAEKRPAAIVLSGGPSSVYEEGAP